MLICKNLEFSPRSSVRSSPTRFLGISSLLFSESLQLIRAYNRKRMFQKLFWKNPVLPILAKNCPKLAIWLDAGFWQDFGIAGNPGKTWKYVFLKLILSKFHTCTFSEKMTETNFSTGPQLSKYVQVFCQNTNGTCIKSVSKIPTFRFFLDFR